MKRKSLRPSSLLLCLLTGGYLNGTAVPVLAHSQEVSQLIQSGDDAAQSGDFKTAIDVFQRASKIEPKSADIHNKLGLCFSRKKQLLEAVGEYRKALACDPHFATAAHNLGSAMYLQGNYDGAIEYYQMALDLNQGNDVESMTNLAQVYRDRAAMVAGAKRDADLQRSLQLFQQALQLNPDSPMAHNNLGLLYLRARHFDEAADEVNKAIKIKGNYAEAYFNLGMIEQARNKMPEALAAFQNSLRYETNEAYKEGTRFKIKSLGVPQAGSDHFSRGYDLLGQRKWSEGEAEFRQCLDSNGADTAVAWNNLGLCLAQQGRMQDAVGAYRKAVSLQPDQFPQAQYNLGQALLHTGDLAGAERALRRAIAQAGGSHALAHNALGMVLKQHGDKKGAQAEYRLAILQSGDMLPVVHFNLGLLLASQPGKTEQAIAQFSQYLTQAPTGANASLANSKIQTLRSNN